MQYPDKPNNSTMQFPQEINSHIAGFIADEVRATDPQCYRAARRLQAVWRSYVERKPPSCSCCSCHCVECTDRVLGPFLFPACQQCGEEDALFVQMEPWTCEACRLDYMIEAFEDGAVSWGSFAPGCPYP